MNIRLKIRAEIEAFLEPAHLDASGEAFGLDFGSLLGLILEPRARSAILAKIEPAL